MQEMTTPDSKEGGAKGGRQIGKARFSLLSTFKWSSSKTDISKDGKSAMDTSSAMGTSSSNIPRDPTRGHLRQAEGEGGGAEGEGAEGEGAEGGAEGRSGIDGIDAANGPSNALASREDGREDGMIGLGPASYPPASAMQVVLPVLPLAYSVFPQLQMPQVQSGSTSADSPSGGAPAAYQAAYQAAADMPAVRERAVPEVWTYERVAMVVGAEAKQLLWAKTAPWLTAAQLQGADSMDTVAMDGAAAGAEYQMQHTHAQKKQRKLSLFSNQQLASHEMLESLLLSTLEKVLCSSFIAEEELVSCEAAFEHQHFRCFFVLLITRPWAALYRRRLQRSRKSRPLRSLGHNSSQSKGGKGDTKERPMERRRTEHDGIGVGMGSRPGVGASVNVSAAHVQFSKARLDSSGLEQLGRLVNALLRSCYHHTGTTGINMEKEEGRGTKQAERALATVEIGEQKGKGRKGKGAEGQQAREREKDRDKRQAVVKDQECVLAVLRFAKYWRCHDIHGLNRSHDIHGLNMDPLDGSDAVDGSSRNSLLGKIGGMHRHRLWSDFHFWRESFSRDLVVKLQREGAQDTDDRDAEAEAAEVEAEEELEDDSKSNRAEAMTEGAARPKTERRKSVQVERVERKARRARQTLRDRRARRVMLYEEQCEEFVGFMVGLGMRSSRVHQAVHYWCTTHTLGHAHSTSHSSRKGTTSVDKPPPPSSSSSSSSSSTASSTRRERQYPPHEVLPPQLAAEVLHVQLRLADSLCSATNALGGGGMAQWLVAVTRTCQMR
jgi:hypothetical protein